MKNRKISKTALFLTSFFILCNNTSASPFDKNSIRNNDDRVEISERQRQELIQDIMMEIEMSDNNIGRMPSPEEQPLPPDISESSEVSQTQSHDVRVIINGRSLEYNSENNSYMFK